MVTRLQTLKWAEFRNFAKKIKNPTSVLNMAWTTWLHVCHCVPGDLHNMESKVLPLQKDMPLCLAEAINVPVPPLQGEWYLSSLIRNICCAHARSLPLSLHSAQRGFFLILHLSGSSGYFSSFIPPPQPAFLSASKWLKFAFCCRGGARR